MKFKRAITRFDIAALACPAFESISAESIKSGFRATGIHPLDRNEVLGTLPPIANTGPLVPLFSPQSLKRKSLSERLQIVEGENASLRLAIMEIQKNYLNMGDGNKKGRESRKRLKTDAICLTSDETIAELKKKEDEKTRKAEDSQKRKKDAAHRKEESEKAKGLRKQQQYFTKFEALSETADRLQKTVVDPKRATQQNVIKLTTQLANLGNLEQFPEVFFLLLDFWLC